MINPSIIDKRTLAPIGRLQPSAMSVNLKIEQPSNVSMTLQEGQPDVSVGDWLRVYTTQGDAGVFVVKSVTKNEMTKDRQVSADHALALLKNVVYFGEFNTDSKNKKPIAPAVALKQALTAQGKNVVWELGKVEYTEAQPFSYDNDDLYSIFDTVRNALEDSQMEADTRSLPFKINIRKRPETASCEMRLSHNITSLSIQVDTDDMFTRIYPIGSDGARISGDYVQDDKRVSEYGLISAVRNNDDITDPGFLKAWAKTELKRHNRPTVTVSINGLELSEATGEPWDKLKPGTVCRVPLVQYHGATVEERIDSVSFRDLIKHPEVVTVTLSNSRSDVKRAKSASGRAEETETKTRHSSGRAKSNLEVVKKYIREVDDGFELRVGKMFETGGQFASIKVLTDQIQSTVTKYKKSNAGDLLVSMQSQITQTANAIKTCVQEGDLISTIEQQAGRVKISARCIDLDGYVTASSLRAGFSVTGTMTARILEVPPGGMIRLFGMNFTTRRMLAADGRSVYTALVAENGGR